MDIFETVLALIACNAQGNDSADIAIDDWNQLFAKLQEQTISAIPIDRLSKLVKTREDKLRLIRAAATHIETANRHLAEQGKLLELFEKNGLRYVILKGLAVARYYPQPEYRTLGDIDIAVLHDEYDTAHDLMLQNGYRELECEYEKHSEFARNGVTFELHRYFASTNDVDKATVVEALIQDGIKSSVICELNGCRFPVLPPLADGIMLLEHMSQHLETGIGLRHVLDWMMYVSHELSDIVWHTSFSKVAEAAGLRKLAEVSTLLCKKHMGLSGISWCDSADVQLCDQLLEYIANRGNFGRGLVDSTDKARKVLTTNKNMMDVLRYLQESGLKTIPYINDHKLLHPFAWLVRGIMLIKRYRHDGNTIKAMREDMEAASKMDGFLDELGIRRVSRGHTFWNGERFIVKK